MDGGGTPLFIDTQPKKDHTKLFEYIYARQATLQRETGHEMQWFNHNLDVPILHFKLGYTGRDF